MLDTDRFRPSNNIRYFRQVQNPHLLANNISKIVQLFFCKLKFKHLNKALLVTQMLKNLPQMPLMLPFCGIIYQEFIKVDRYTLIQHIM